MGVAIPHVKLAGLDSVVCSLVVLEQSVEWMAVDGAPVVSCSRSCARRIARTITIPRSTSR